MTLKRFLDFQERKVLENSFVLLNFNYCTHVWMFENSKSLTKIENLHKKALRLMLHNYSSSWERTLEKSGKYSIDVKRKHKLCTDIYIYITLYYLHPSLLKEISELRLCCRPVKEQNKLNLNIPRRKQVALGTESLESLGRNICNNLP